MATDRAPKRVYILSPEEKKMLEERHREIERGMGIPHEEVCREVEEWFRQKASRNPRDEDEKQQPET